MLKSLNLIIGALNLALFGTLSVMIWQGYWTPTVGSSSIEYKDFVSILLTAIGVMITILAAIAAVAAFWGFESVKRSAMEAAKEKADAVARVVAADVASRTTVETSAVFKTQTDDGLDYGKSAGRGPDNGHP